MSSPAGAPVTLLVHNAGPLVTVAGSHGSPAGGARQGAVGIVPDGAVAAAGERIVAVGTSAEVLRSVEVAPDAEVIDARGALVLPGFVDPHTHLVYAGERQHEFPRRLRGESYLDILAAGGGILATVEATRRADEATLAELTRSRLDVALAHGTTTMEIKSGYGLDTTSELKQLRAVRRAASGHAIDVVPTFMGAHAVPATAGRDADAYVELVIEEMIPAVAAERLARFCDVFCEHGVFSVEQSRRVLQAGVAAGLRPKLHADELAGGGGAELAAELRAVSADHLVHASEAGIAAMAAEGVLAVLLPGTTFALMGRDYAPARRMVEAGLPVALATDANPGSSPTESMQIILNLACLQLRLSPAEAVVAATLNAAHAVGMADTVGSLEVGKRADLVIYDAPDLDYLAYHYGTNLARRVVAGGRTAWTRTGAA